MAALLRVFVLLAVCFGLLHAADYVVKVRTGSSYWAGTDANVVIKIVGTKGITSEHKLSGSGKVFERGSLDTFTFDDVIDVGQLTSVKIKRDEKGWFANWQLFKIGVLSKGEWTMFLYDKWIPPNRWVVISATCETDHKKNPQTGACEGPICGKKPSSRPVGESRVSHRAWPWLGIVEFDDGSRVCSGSLISSRWVMTTAWCVYRKNPTSLRVRFGADNVKNRIKTEQVVNVLNSFIQPQYHRITLMSHDLALLKLAHPVTISNELQPACLPSAKVPSPVNDPNRKCWFPIWERKSGDLREVPIPMVNLTTCLKYKHALPKLHESMVCGVLDRKATGPCTSDAGGPLVCQSHGKWYLEGLISTGTDCYVDAPKGRIFTNIRFLNSWAQKIIRENPEI